MSETDFSLEVFDAIDQEIVSDALSVNKRVAVRYRRSDIKAVVKIHSALYPRLVPVILHDISSKGAGVISPKPLGKASKVTLYLLFKDHKRFEIDAVVVYCNSEHVYGLKFKCFHELLAEHLLRTQTDLKFS